MTLSIFLHTAAILFTLMSNSFAAEISTSSDTQSDTETVGFSKSSN